MAARLAGRACAKKKRLFRPAPYRARQNRRREHANFGGALECLPCAALIPVAQRISYQVVRRLLSVVSTNFALHTVRCTLAEKSRSSDRTAARRARNPCGTFIARRVLPSCPRLGPPGVGGALAATVLDAGRNHDRGNFREILGTTAQIVTFVLIQSSEFDLF